MAERQLLSDVKDEARFYTLYHAFVKGVISPHFGNKVTYSTHPRFRVHMPNTPSVSAWHRDVDVTGRFDQINAWVPFVDSFDTVTVWVETDYGKQDFAPIPVKYGQVLLFDGGCLWHGSVANETPVTRVSMDLRFAPMRTDLDNPDLGILAGRPANVTILTVKQGAYI